jgi:hypothetical protein
MNKGVCVMHVILCVKSTKMVLGIRLKKLVTKNKNLLSYQQTE